MPRVNPLDSARVDVPKTHETLLTDVVSAYKNLPLPNQWNPSGECLGDYAVARVEHGTVGDPAVQAVCVALNLSGWTAAETPIPYAPSPLPPSGHKFMTDGQTETSALTLIEQQDTNGTHLQSASTPSGHKFAPDRENPESYLDSSHVQAQGQEAADSSLASGHKFMTTREEYHFTQNMKGKGAADAGRGIFTLRLAIDENARPEQYSLQVSGSESNPTVALKASTPAGFFYGALTTASLVKNKLLTNETSINDEPRFEHRGFMLDVARSYQPISVLHNIIDAAALLKLNALHLHLVDDQGWRMEITNEGRAKQDRTDYTLLHRISGTTAVSGGKTPGFDESDETTGSNAIHDDVNRGYEGVEPGHAGWYTQNELQQLVAYAAERHIRIIPELEFPGHNHSVLYALPELATAGAWVNASETPIAAWTRWQVGYSYLDFDNPHTWTFAKHVLRQCAQVFGTQSIHLGADECYKLIEAVGQKRYDDIVERVVELAHECGFEHVSVWQEGVRALNSAHKKVDAVQLWNYTKPEAVDELLEVARDRGVEIINSDARHLYLDQKIALDDPRGLTWAVVEGLPTRATYDWDPLQHIPVELHSDVRGIEACLWSETVRSIDDIAYLCLPRLAAIAEVAWTQQKNRSWQSLAARLSLD